MPELYVDTLGNVVAQTGGALQTGPFGSQLHASDYRRTGTPLIMPANLGDNEINGDGVARVGSKDVDRLRRHVLRENDIVFSRRGDVGRRSIVRKDRAGWLCGTGCLAARFGPDRRLINPEYIADYLGTATAQSWLADNAVGGTMPNLNTGILAALPILLPSRPEQDHIDSVIQAARSAIIDLDRVITKKQAIRHALMQQLLTGRVRLPGFETAWEVRSVAEMGTVLAGKALNATGPGVMRPYLRTKNVLDGRIDLGDVLTMPVTDAEFVRFRVVPNDVLLNEGQSLDLVGRCSLYSGELGEPCVIQNQLLRFRSFEWTFPEFAAHLFRRCQMSGVFASIATQTTSVAHLGSSRLKNLRLAWPADRREQTAIAEVLNDADREVLALRASRIKACSIRQGMTQKLLTGRMRPSSEIAR